MRGYDQWLTTDTRMDEPDVPLPGYDPDYPRCDGTPERGCGAFLKRDEFTVTYGEQTGQCDGRLYPDVAACDKTTEHDPHPYVVWAWGERHRVCARCGHENIEVEP